MKTYANYSATPDLSNSATNLAQIPTLAQADLDALAASINQAHADAQAYASKAVERAKEAGDHLLLAKAQVRHGEWAAWLKAHCPRIAERTARSYMQLARNWTTLEAKTAGSAVLTISEALALLAAPDDHAEQHDLLAPPEPQTPVAFQDRIDAQLLPATPAPAVSAATVAAMLAQLPEPERRAVIDTTAGEFKVVRADAGNVHVSQGNNDWYTPRIYVEAARTVMGGIDLDPASSDIAQATVKATTYFTAETNSLDKPWHGRVWMNPPFSMPLIQQFVDKLLAEWRELRVSQAIVLTNNGTETEWFQALLNATAGVCFPSARIKFYSPVRTSSSPRQGQAIFYLPDITHRQKRNHPDPVADFKQRFSEFGTIVEASL